MEAGQPTVNPEDDWLLSRAIGDLIIFLGESAQEKNDSRLDLGIEEDRGIR